MPIPCPCGNKDCLERYISLDALQKKFGFTNYKNVIDKAYSGEKEGLKVIDYITSYLGKALVTATNLLDFDKIIIYGDFGYRPELLTEKIKGYMLQNSVVSASHGISITFLEITEETDSKSSTAAIVDNYFNQQL